MAIDPAVSSEEAPPPKPRRRRTWLWIAGAVLLLPYLETLVWRYWPLSEIEQQLVGTWRSAEGSELRFGRDHSYETTPNRPAASRTWSASGSIVTYRYWNPFPRSWSEVPGYWKSATGCQDYTAFSMIVFDEDGRLHLTGTDLKRHGTGFQKLP